MLKGVISGRQHFVLRRYVTSSAFGNSAWEALHSPLYRGWMPSLISEFPLLLARCVVVDTLLALAALALTLWLAGSTGWPNFGFWIVGGWTIVLGVALAIFVEWSNVYFLDTWGYSNAMPVIPFLEVGVSPVFQWVTIPLIGFWWARPRGSQ